MPRPTLPVRAVRVRALVGVCALIAITGWGLTSRGAFVHALGQVWALPGPSWPSIVVAVTAVVASYGCSALALCAAAGRWLPFGRTFLVQLAAAAANRVTPGGLGGAAVNARFLTGQGLSVGAASAAISLTAIAHGAVALIGVLLMGPALVRLSLPGSLGAARLGGIPVVVVGISVIAVLGVLVAIAVRGRCRVSVPFAAVVRDAWDALVAALRQPRRLLALVVATTAVKGYGYWLARARARSS